MRVYVLFHETNSGHSDESDGYVEAVYSTQELAEAEMLRAIKLAIADGRNVWYDPETDACFEDWDDDWSVQAWDVQETPVTEFDWQQLDAIETAVVRTVLDEHATKEPI